LRSPTNKKNLKEKTLPCPQGNGLQGFSFVRAFRTNHNQKHQQASHAPFRQHQATHSRKPTPTAVISATMPSFQKLCRHCERSEAIYFTPRPRSDVAVVQILFRYRYTKFAPPLITSARAKASLCTCPTAQQTAVPPSRP